MEESTIPVTVIGQSGVSLLVQWNDGGKTKRNFVPVKSVVEGLCPSDILAISPPYGSQWEKVIQSAIISPNDIADALRASGFWTVQDIERDPDGAQNSVTRAIGVLAASICRLARQAEREVNHD